MAISSKAGQRKTTAIHVRLEIKPLPSHTRPNSLYTAFATDLQKRFKNPGEDALYQDLNIHIRGLPLPASSALTAKQAELDRLGTELWNLSTRLRRDETWEDSSKEIVARQMRSICLLRAYACLLLDSAGGRSTHVSNRKNCIRLMKVALKAAKDCIDGKEMSAATKVLERAAEYEDNLAKGEQKENAEQHGVEKRLRIEYFAVRTTLVRLDITYHQV